MKRIPIIILLCVVVSALLVWDYKNFTDKGASYYKTLAQPFSTNDIDEYLYSQDELKIEFDSKKDAYFTLPVSFKLSFWKRLRLSLTSFEGVHFITVYYRFKDKPNFTENNKSSRIIAGDFGEIYDFILPPGEYDYIRIDFDGSAENASVVIKDLRVVDFGIFYYGELYFYPLAFFILCLLVVPGSLLHALIPCFEKSDQNINLVLFFSLSIVFYLTIYLVLVFSLYLDIDTKITVPLSFFTLLAVLIVLVKVRKRIKILSFNLKKEKKSFQAAAIIVFISCLLFTGFVESPFKTESINHNTVDKDVIFSKFSGHDNLFQYVNGKSIADDEPFSTYYSKGELVYLVQDREMLPGVIYAVFRTLLSSFNAYIGESYLTYSILGLCMNVMVIFPLIVLFRRYFSKCNEYYFILLLSLNTFVLPNYYFTWFKFSGAALFLSGIIILLQYREKMTGWITAGTLFGLSSNMHAGNALGIPFVFIWVITLNLKTNHLLSKKVLFYPSLLAFIFIVVNLPWSIVKSIYFTDHHTLLKQHFFPGTNREVGIIESIKIFWLKHPWREQLSYRWGNIINSFRLTEIGNSFNWLFEKKTRLFTKTWSNYEFFFFSLSIYPLFIVASISRLVSAVRVRNLSICGDANSQNEVGREVLTLLCGSFLTIFAIIFMSYDKFPDTNHQLPMGVILTIHTILIGVSMNSGKTGKILLSIYGIISFWAILTYIKHYIF